MPLLELEINCLCLYARDTGQNGDEQILHVLMPRTNGTGPHAGHHRHVARMFHRNFAPEEQEKGRSIEGWALVLGDGKGTADLTLMPPTEPALKAVIPDIGALSGGEVDPDLVADAPNDKVAARITLRSGRITRLVSEAEFKLGNKIVFLAHQVTWQMQGVPYKLDWRRLHAPASEAEPLATLRDLETESNLGYKLRIFHVTENSLPPITGGTLTRQEIKEHYAMLYPLLGVDNPGPRLLPDVQGPGTDGVHCVKGGGDVQRA